ncbi:MAG: hypothetical protein EOP56_08990 [Sphingobacteriales bacterium]|nr:MAG: hypothetical protein EOP56_08990 [Sphingobacteriales bacterium]
MNKLTRILMVVMGLAMAAFILNVYTPVLESVNAAPAKDKAKKGNVPTGQIQIVNKWEVPDILKEISGIAWIDNNRFACVQDEKGIIFIYNTSSGKIEREVSFAGDGDFEDIVLIGKVAYMLRSDGHIFEVNNIDITKPQVREYETPLTTKQNIEGLAYDKKNERLLATVKDKETGDNSYKGIYAFSLSTKKMQSAPVYKIKMDDPMFGKGKKKKGGMFPSAIAIHPTTGNIYVLEGRNPKLLVMKPDGSVQTLYTMNKDDFAQAEGLSFSPDGRLFISNEGVKESGNILAVKTGN